MKKKDKKIWIVGTGLGGMRLMTRQVSAVLKMARLFIGSSEVLETVRRYASENGARPHRYAGRSWRRRRNGSLC